MSRASRASRGKRKPKSGRRSDAVVIRGADEPFAEAFIPAIEARGNDAALIVLTAIGAAASGGPESVHKAATVAASRLAATGVPVPAWSQQLEQPPEAFDADAVNRRLGTLR